MYAGFSQTNLEEGGHLEGLKVTGSTVMCFFMYKIMCFDWINLAQENGQMTGYFR